MGGMGTFELVARNPDYFAAAFPICGGGNQAILKSTPGFSMGKMMEWFQLTFQKCMKPLV